jgi:hypothetical protein
MTEQMTLTRALAELKTLDKRIEKKSQSLHPLGIVVNKKLRVPNQQQNPQEFEHQVQGEWQSIQDLMERRKKIKSALVQANASTNVEIAGQQMTIAEAIDLKNFITYKKNLLKTLRTTYQKANQYIEQHNQKVEQNLQALLEQQFGKDSNSRPKEEDYEAISKPFWQQNGASMLDPINIQKQIESLENEIFEFETNVDYALSEVNSQTYIEV